MFIDTRFRAETSTLHADICIIGSGIAGLTLAREFLNRGERVLVLEAGIDRVTAKSQNIYRGSLSGAPAHSLSQSRFRAYGGSGTRWTGQCVPMQSIDFEPRAHMPESGWPVTLADMKPYYQRAEELLGITSPGFNLDAWQAQEGTLDAIAGDELSASIITFAKPLDIGAALKEELTRSDNVTVVLNAYVSNIELDDSLQQVSSVWVKSEDSRTFRCQAKHYVLACGGVENARLLLASNRQLSAGVGNEHDLVGRYFMDHPYLTTGYWQPSKKAQALGLFVIENFDRLAQGRAAHAVFTLTEEIHRHESLMGCTGYFIRMARHEVMPGYFSKGSQALIQLADMAKGHRTADAADALRLLKDMTLDPLSSWQTLSSRIRSVCRPDVILALRMVLEASPCRESRVTLSAERDAFDEPRAHVHWCIRESDWMSLERFRDAMAKAIRQQGLGELIDDKSLGADGWPTSMNGGKHHMGTTRMHHEPHRGVVDENLRIHSLANCYIAGSSVFPTGSWVNPTFTLVALSLRLAEHLKKLSATQQMNEVSAEC